MQLLLLLGLCSKSQSGSASEGTLGRRRFAEMAWISSKSKLLSYSLLSQLSNAFLPVLIQPPNVVKYLLFRLTWLEEFIVRLAFRFP